jgi:hypothetical protein
MKFNVLSLLIMAMVISISSCEGKKETEKKEVQKKAAAGYVINFKPNDSLDLVPPKTLILQQSSAEGQNIFCLDVMAKTIDRVSEVVFELNFDPAGISYQSYKPGVLFEQKGKPAYKIGLKGDQKGKLEVKISFESGTGGGSGSGKLITLCFKALEPGRRDILFENGELLDLRKKKMAGVTWVGGLLWVLEA